MASALASPPPPFSFGSSDLKRNARKFLERALVISALVHLVAGGLFRAAYERGLAREGPEIPPPVWTRPVDLGPRILPPLLPGIAPPVSDKGIIHPNIFEPPTMEPFDPGAVKTGVQADPNTLVGPRTNREDPPGPPPPAEPAKRFTIAEIQPVPISTPLPAYPEFAREAQIEGKVIVRVLVGVDGLPKRVVAVSGPSVLLEAAADGVRRWKFQPGMTSGEPVEVWVEVPVIFRLQ